nr:hypothetical protein [Bacteroides intestinalis]
MISLMPSCLYGLFCKGSGRPRQTENPGRRSLMENLPPCAWSVFPILDLPYCGHSPLPAEKSLEASRNASEQREQ